MMASSRVEVARPAGIVTVSTNAGRAGWRVPRWLRHAGQEPLRVRDQTDDSPLAEGLYIKVEEQGQVVARYKWVRASFLTSVADSGGHWI
ncbi:MAG: hypothetical protein K0V04_25965, partial [Deltaproteobacteria bacterium]|nr:hypothetical protein [Deltaproteobacteria bacterium]